VIQAPSASYYVNHAYDLQLTPGQVYRGAWVWYADAMAISRSQGIVHPPPDQGMSVFAPPAAANKNANAVSGNLATADANALFAAGSNGKGFHEISGSASIVPNDGTYARASSSSTTALSTGIQIAKGVIRWNPNWMVDSIFGEGTAWARDPIIFDVKDIGTGKTIAETLFDIDVGVSGGTANWNDGDVTINGGTGDGHFSVKMDSPHMTSVPGTLSLSWMNGVITESIDTGTFDGILPSVGAPASLIAHLGDAYGGFDIGFDFGTGNFDLTANLDASGSAAVPEPSTAIAGAIMFVSLLLSLPKRTRSASTN
jgi:hypothetical protein